MVGHTEQQHEPTILAIDPGVTTGLAWCPTTLLEGGVLDDRFASLVELGIITGGIGDQVWKVHKGISRLNVRMLVTETNDHFLLSPAMKGRLTQSSLVPVRLNGAFEFLQVAEQFKGRALARIEQTSSQGKSTVTDQQLQALGFRWKKSSDDRHSMDAVRHLIVFIRRMKESRRKKTAFYREVMDAGFRG